MALNVPWTILGPVSFLDGFASAWMQQGLGNGQFVFLVPASKSVQVVALADLAAVAALVFEEPGRFADRRIEVATDDLTAPRMADVLAEVIGHPIAHVSPPLDTLGVDANGDMAAMMRWMADVGYDVNIGELHGDLPEVRWHSFESWARTIAWKVPR